MRSDHLGGGSALLAFQRCEDTDDAMLGAMMQAEFQAVMLELARAYFKVHSK